MADPNASGAGDAAPDEPNLLVVDAFKPVIDAILANDALYLDDYGHVPKQLSRREAELLADYVEQRVQGAGLPPSLAAIASILGGVTYLQEVFGVLRERCAGEES